jgi:hypothetical protein
MHAPASKRMYMSKLLASWRRKFSLAVHVVHADNVLRGLSAAVDGVEAASSSVEMPFHAMHAWRYAPAPWAASVPVLPRPAREAPPLVASMCHVLVAICVMRVNCRHKYVLFCILLLSLQMEV